MLLARPAAYMSVDLHAAGPLLLLYLHGSGVSEGAKTAMLGCFSGWAERARERERARAGVPEKAAIHAPAGGATAS